jgi:hypothetical protein
LNWTEVAMVFFASHLVGDFLLQTEWQATRKAGGLGRDPEARRALLSHTFTYTLAFLPALVWIGIEAGVGVAVVIALVIAVPHMIVDDRRLLKAYMRRVKHTPEPAPASLSRAVDQSTHLVCLFLSALLAGAIS